MEAVMWGLICFILYFLPHIIAAARDHHNRIAIFCLNLLAGWTILGWFAALIWSLTAVRPELKTSE